LGKGTYDSNVVTTSNRIHVLQLTVNGINPNTNTRRTGINITINKDIYFCLTQYDLNSGSVTTG